MLSETLDGKTGSKKRTTRATKATENETTDAASSPIAVVNEVDDDDDNVNAGASEDRVHEVAECPLYMKERAMYMIELWGKQKEGTGHGISRRRR